MTAASIKVSDYSRSLSSFGGLEPSEKTGGWWETRCAPVVTKFTDQVVSPFVEAFGTSSWLNLPNVTETAVLTASGTRVVASPGDPTVQWRGCGASDVAVFPGALATSELVEKLQRRTRLLRLISLLRVDESNGGQGFDVSEETAGAARRFVSAIPVGSALPSVAPDGEGALLMIWGPPNDETLVVIDDWNLSMVQHVGRNDAVYADNLPFDGRTLPPLIAQAIAAL